MFSCAAKTCRKNPDKIEGMASWLILGGVLPLAASFLANHQNYYNFQSFFTPERIPYLWVIAMGIASLLVKRTSGSWRFIVALGAIGFLAAAEVSVKQGNIAGLMWPLAVMILIYKQYRYDMKSHRH